MSAAGAVESVRLPACDGERLVAVLAQAGDGVAARDIGVVVVVGGPQVRAGSHRQFVGLARRLAQQGWPTLRFDARGMGDSSGAQRGFEQFGADIGAAVDDLCAACPGLRGVVLWGLCDGASAALLYLDERRDPRVAGLCLVNPWVRSAQSLARTHVKHYYARRLLEPAFWRKLLRGQVAADALAGLWRNLRLSRARPAADHRQAFQDRMAAAWGRFGGPIQLVLSGDDYTAREFVEYTRASAAWAGLAERPTVQQVALAGADHTFSDPAAQAALERALVGWLDRLQAGPA